MTHTLVTLRLDAIIRDRREHAGWVAQNFSELTRLLEAAVNMEKETLIMPKKKKGKHYVIYAQPERHGAGPNSYFDKDGNVTKMKDEAMSFLTFDDAQEWANEHEIQLGGSRYIQEEEYEYWVP